MRVLLTALLLFLPLSAQALTPICRTDVVPYQRIEYGSTFKFGVVAFSKAGIDRVDFAISGQGYSGGTKTSSTMQLNTRLAYTESSDSIPNHNGWPGVYEYYVEIQASEFTSDGAITVTPTCYGNDSGSRTLSPTTLIVEATGAGSHPEAWVDSVSGSDGTGTVGNSSLPYATINAAIQAAQTANGGSSDGNIIYLKAGSYTLSGNAASTTGEWLTIKNADGVARSSITINNGGSIDDTSLLKIEGVTLYSGGTWDYVVDGSGTIWIDKCTLTSVGRYMCSTCTDANVYPVDTADYITNSYAYDVDRAATNPLLLRNFTAEQIAEDVARNSGMLVNIRVDDQDNGSNDGQTNYFHSDAYQAFLGAPTNTIIYNYLGTDLHYQGLFMRQVSQSNNNALVNIFLEMRSPGTKGSSTGNQMLMSGALYAESGAGSWDHLLIWHVSLLGGRYSIYDVDNRNEIENISIIGSVFYEFAENGGTSSVDPDDIFGSSNTLGNEALYNHYMRSYVTADDACDGGVYVGCEHYSCSPDSGITSTQSVGSGVINLADTAGYGSQFGQPLATATDLLSAMPSNLTGLVADVNYNLLDTTPDKGAMQYQTGALTCYPDVDGDLYRGIGSVTAESCPQGYYESTHFVSLLADCDDTDPDINPGETDICGNGIDEDCSGSDSSCGGGGGGALISNGTAIYVNSSGEAYALPE